MNNQSSIQSRHNKIWHVTAVFIREEIDNFTQGVKPERLDKYNVSYEQFCDNMRYGIYQVLRTPKLAVDKTIFSSHEDLENYRFWHDMVHYEYGIAFGGRNEYMVAGILYQKIIDAGLCRHQARLLYADLVCHIDYYDKHKEHPTDQLKIIREFFSTMDWEWYEPVAENSKLYAADHIVYTPYQLGRLYSRQGKDISTNPFLGSTKSFIAFRRGFIETLRENDND